MTIALLSSAGGADPSVTRVQTASIREVVYFGTSGPVRVRLQISIDGRPVDGVWLDAVNGLFAFRDRDNDGFLDVSERAPFALPTRAARDSVVDAPGVVQPLRLTFAQKDEKIACVAFAEALRAAGFGSVGLRIIPNRADSRQLSEALFRLLDQNGDGRLSQDELKAARERLAFLDIDEDEYITAAELLNRSMDVNAGRARPNPRGTRSPMDQADSSNEMVFLTTDGAQAVKQLLLARGGARATSLKPAQFGADAKKFAALDQDGNGVLDTTELTAWLRQPPDLEMAIVFEANKGHLSVIAPETYTTEKNGIVQAALPGGRLRFEAPIGAPTQEWEQNAARLRDQFQELAKEKGFVEKKQLEKQPSLLAFFDFADRNGDGKVDATEVEAALKVIAPLARCRADIAFADKGNGLFELLDRNGDGRLSPRELVEAAQVLKPFAGSDGSIGPKELARRFDVQCAIEPIPVGVLIAPARPVPGDGSRQPVNLPAWFTRMDRNGDGDISLREFVGPIELFRKLDKNGDGLISPEEAIAAGK
jgi:Ca2+-binding EF-hand superfamily protein